MPISVNPRPKMAVMSAILDILFKQLDVLKLVFLIWNVKGIMMVEI